MFDGLIRPPVEEGVFVMHDGWRMAQHNRDRVEANLIPLDPGARDVTAGGACDVFLLFEIDGAIRVTEFRRRACLDFDEDQQIAAARHNVDF